MLIDLSQLDISVSGRNGIGRQFPMSDKKLAKVIYEEATMSSDRKLLQCWRSEAVQRWNYVLGR